MTKLASLSGTVRHGSGRGRELGFPTANLAVDTEALELSPGVYVGRARWEGSATYGAVVNFGVRPTFAESEFCLEVYVIDFTGDLYGREIILALSKRLRDEKRFDSAEELTQQIQSDIDCARRILASLQPA